MTFDDGYDRGDVVRLFFGHAVGNGSNVPYSTEDSPFAAIDLIVTADAGDAIEGYRSDASAKTRGTLDDTTDEPTPTVHVSDEPLIIRKAAVVMKREFGNVPVDDVGVAQDDSGEFRADPSDP